MNGVLPRAFDLVVIGTGTAAGVVAHTCRRAGWSVAVTELIEKPSGRVLGAHLLGPRADDAINLFAMAMRTGTNASVLKETLFAYPTAGSDLPYML
jgi:pyruvate/2-oxoglutarate dehydrogenase complex dihydrolipoamide dehydrogenase (E3) component